MYGEDFSQHLIALSKEYERRRIHGTPSSQVFSRYVTMLGKTMDTVRASSIMSPS